MQLALRQLTNLANPATVPDVQLTPLPGGSLVLEPVDWAAFEQLLAALGERRTARLADDRG